MKAKQGVVDLLNKLLTEELTVINQYFLHAKMCKNWGYDRLHHHVLDRSYGEMKDAKEVIDRILYLEGLPNMQRLGTVKIGETVPEQLKADLDKEKSMVKMLTEGIQHCTKVGD
ncbi:MAG: bacterioferritin, partial [Nitrospira sp. SB0667_bin_9]|nr:bacterioferritin [Nitrospira sp. SB0667_bin_9]